jgi:hypothetical protein
MPICIAGMHRSGTSMVARVLHTAGLYLGREEDLKGPSEHNRDGFWEHRKFVELNEEILNELGGGWDCPPPFPDRWTEAEGLLRLKVKAEALLEEFADREPWGWKDPRNSLTLPFWMDRFPAMKVVVCVRNPLEVVLSLRERNLSSYALSLILWRAYNERVLAATRPENRIVTHYDAYADDPRREVRRLLDFLGLPATEEVIDRCCSVASADLRHHRLTTRHLVDADVAPDLLDLYLRLCAEAGRAAGPGPVGAGSLALGAAGRPDRSPPESAPPMADGRLAIRGGGRLDRSSLRAEVLEQKLTALRAERDRTIAEERAERDRTIAEVRAERDRRIGELRAERDRRIDELRAERDRTVGDLRAKVADRDATIGGLRTRVEEDEATIGELREALHDLRAKLGEVRGKLEVERRTIAEMSGTRAWRLHLKYARARERVDRWLGPLGNLPPGLRRG